VFDFLDPIQLFTLDTTLITTLLVVSVHMTFRSGMFSLAPMGFAAIGGYTTAILTTEHEASWVVGSVAGTLMAALIAAVFAAPMLRLRGIYMALGTLALSQAIVVAIRNFEFTNGTLGIAGIPLEARTEHMVGLLLVAFVLLQLTHRSHFGRAATAIRLDERTAEGLGIGVFRVRFVSFVAASGVAGLAGALEAHRTSVISPDQYGFATLVVVFTYVLVGGHGHWAGPIAVCWVVAAVRESLHFAGTEWENIIYGSLLVGVMMVAPNGLSDRSLYRGLRRRFGDVRTRVDRARASTEAPPGPSDGPGTPTPAGASATSTSAPAAEAVAK
jgi:branched-chain amino acid transport system permease protein